MFVALDAIKGLPQRPFVATEEAGIFNFRDVGGYPIRDRVSYSFRQNLIFRSSEPSRITTEGENLVRDTGIKIIFDIRLPEELPQPPQQDGHATDGNTATTLFDGGIKEIGGIERLHIDPSKSDEMPEGAKSAFLDGFKDLPKFTTERFIAKVKVMLERGINFRPIFEHLLQPNPEPFLVHCTAGKDRTGMLIMLFQSLAGVPREFIVEEYALSDRGMRMTAPEIVKMLTRNPNMPMPEDWANNLVLAKREYMEGLVDVLEKEYGGIEKYLREYVKLSTLEQERIRKNLVAEKRPIYISDNAVKRHSWNQDWIILSLVAGLGFFTFPLIKSFRLFGDQMSAF